MVVEGLRGLGVVIFLSYATVCKGTFRHFHCSIINGQSLLVADYNISCDSEQHYRLLPWALLGLAFVVMVPLAWAIFITHTVCHPIRRSSLMVISDRHDGMRGSVYRTVGSMFAHFNFPKNDDDLNLSSLISASWESIRMLYVSNVFLASEPSLTSPPPPFPLTRSLALSFSRKAVLIALSVFLSKPESRAAQLVLALAWLVLNVSQTAATLAHSRNVFSMYADLCHSMCSR